MFREGQRLRFIKPHGSMNKHLKKLVGKECVAVGDSYSYGKTLVCFELEPMKPTFNIANERLAIATEVQTK
jgi:hypothetical protein